MSEYTVCETKLTDAEVLKESLIGIGVNPKHIEEHEEAQQLEGYQGDLRDQKAHIIIRRKHVGSASNDIGFERQANGTYKAWVSQFDKNVRLGRKIVSGELSQGYSKRMVEKEIAKTRGWSLKESQKDKNGKLRMKIRIRY
jgi:hypothetical protein